MVFMNLGLYSYFLSAASARLEKSTWTRLFGFVRETDLTMLKNPRAGDLAYVVICFFRGDDLSGREFREIMGHMFDSLKEIHPPPVVTRRADGVWEGSPARPRVGIAVLVFEQEGGPERMSDDYRIGSPEKCIHVVPWMADLRRFLLTRRRGIRDARWGQHEIQDAINLFAGRCSSRKNVLQLVRTP